MFNLLPDALKEHIKKDYKIRFMTLAFVFVIILQIACLGLLFPSWVISYSKERGVIAEADNGANSQFFKDSDSVTSTILSTNARLGYIANALDYPEVRPFIDSIIKSKTSSIHLSDFTYANKNKSSATLSIGGVAATRETLTSFVKRLQDSGVFKTVDLPISNLAKDKDINFSINLTVSI